MSFAVSDVETHHRGIRVQVLVHSVLGFFYNAAVIGVAVGAVTTPPHEFSAGAECGRVDGISQGGNDFRGYRQQSEPGEW